MERIFISYKRVNKDVVFPLVDRIEESLGVKCWVDLDGIESSAQFASVICTAIDNAEVVLFMHSSAHLDIDFENDWTVKELNYAQATGKRVVLVKLDDAPLKNIFLMNYGTKNNRDSNVPEQMEKLMRDLRGWLKLDSTDNVISKSQLDPSEMCERGDDFYYGRNGVSRDYAEAVKWYRKAAEQGSADALCNLGYCYEFGCYDFEGVSPNITEAVKWYRKAVEQGSARALFRLGFCYKLGNGVSEDSAEALKLYRKAAEQGDVLAQYELGQCYLFADSVPRDYLEAFKWYRMAAEQGSADAQCRVGEFYELGNGVSQDLEEAVKWYRKAAEQGDANGQYFLGMCYKDGMGVVKNMDEAYRWLTKSAEQGNIDASLEL